MDNATLNFGSRDQVAWSTLVVMLVFHVFAVAALFFSTWDAILVAFALHWVCVGWGIGLGYHRLHTHRSYKVPKIVEYFFAVCATMALQGGPIFWTAVHRIHHQYSDDHGDPHTPRDGKWWAHMLWTLFGETLHSNTAVVGKYAPDLMQAIDFARSCVTCHRWLAVAALGSVLQGRLWTPRDLVGQLRDASVGKTAL